MKKFWLVIAVLLLVLSSGCAEKEPVTPSKAMKAVEPVGQVFDPFPEIIENNIFVDITAFDGRLLRSETYKDPNSEAVMHLIQMLDVYGNVLASYTCSSEAGYSVTTLSATEDGGFLFALGFWDHSYPDNTWASEKGFASHVIKCDKDGNLQFDLALDGVEGSALRHVIEKNGCYYFFGDVQTPETKTRGVHSPTDIYMTVLDRNGSVLNSRCIGGTDFDDLNAVETTEEGFLLSITAQSEDGDFAGSGSDAPRVDWVFAVNDSFEIISKKQETGRSYFDEVIGIKDGAPVYQSNEIFKEFDAGTPTALIDYGDYYLIVSSNITGEYEHTPPYISMTWHYWETVYSAYKHTGELIFRAAVDSSPDYDAMVKDLNTPSTEPTKPEHAELYMPDYTLQQIGEYFEEVVLKTEYSDEEGDNTLVQKWIIPLRYRIYGTATEEDMAVLKDLFAQLNEVPGFPGIYEAEEGLEETLSIYFLDQTAFNEKFQDFFGGEDAYGGTRYWYYTDTNEIYTAYIGYRTDIDQQTRSSILLEEIINVLGITDTVLREDSIVYQYSNGNMTLSDIDWLIVKLLYDPAIQAGMDADRCAEVLQELYY